MNSLLMKERDSLRADAAQAEQAGPPGPVPPEISGEEALHPLLTRPVWLPSWVNDELTYDYYMREFGVPVFGDAAVFECLSLEVFMAGLSWRTVLLRRDALRAAFAGFDMRQLAGWGESEIAAALAHPGVIRNRAKAAAVVANARVFCELRDRYGVGPARYVWSFMPAHTPCPGEGDAVPAEMPESTLFARHFKKLGGKFLGPKLAFSLFAAIGVVDVHALGSPRRGVSGLWLADGVRSELPLPTDVSSPLPVALTVDH